MNFVRSPNLVAYWRGEQFNIEEFGRRRRITLAPIGVLLLEEFSKPKSPSRVAQSFPPYTPRSVLAEIEKLKELGFLVPAKKEDPPPGLAEAWGDSFEAAYYHFSTRDLHFTTEPNAKAREFRRRLAAHVQPTLYKNYPGKPRVSFQGTDRPLATTLHDVLQRRRTVREFRNQPVPFRRLAALIRGTWGQTGWIDGGLLGKLLAKTSPSGGSRHPTECYVIVLRVAGLPSGLYHYSVQNDCLEELRRGDLSADAVRIASGQQWIDRAAFVCVMTALVNRTFWKYSPRIGYRALYLDAGHLGQTFCLLATALNLGPFTTAAIQQTHAERLLGLDGVQEFPVYLCGAGIPAPRARQGNSIASGSWPSLGLR